MNVNANYFLFLIYFISFSSFSFDFNVYKLDPLDHDPDVNMFYSKNIEPDLDCDEYTHQFLTSTLLSLESIANISLCNSTQLKITWSNVQKESYGVGLSSAAFMPTITASIGSSQNTTKSNSDLSVTNLEGSTNQLNFAWRLFDFGTRNSNLNASKSLLDSSLNIHSAALQKNLLVTVNSYFDYLNSYLQYKNKYKNLSLVNDLHESNLRKFDYGLVSSNDILNSSSAIVKANLILIKSEGELAKAKTVLVNSMGIQMDPALINIQHDIVFENLFFDIKDLNFWLSQALLVNPSIKSAFSQYQVSQHKLEAARTEGLPTLDLNYNQYSNGYPSEGFSMPGRKVNSLSFTLNIPIFEGFSSLYKIKSAIAINNQSQAQLDEIKLQTINDVVKSYSELLSYSKNYDAAKSFHDTALSLMENTRKRFDNGAADISDLINSQSVFFDAKHEFDKSRIDLFSSKFKLLANVGFLEKKDFILK